MTADVRRLREEDLRACEAIVRALPEYFTDDVPDRVRADARQHDTWVLEQERAVVGFIVVERRGGAAGEILWIAVRPQDRGMGHGTRLLGHALAELRAGGVAVVEVKTLDGSAGYAPYEATRAFYERRGFVQIDRIDPLPGWPPGNPAALYVAALAKTA